MFFIVSQCNGYTVTCRIWISWPTVTQVNAARTVSTLPMSAGKLVVQSYLSRSGRRGAVITDTLLIDWLNSNRSWGGQGFWIPCLELAPPPSHGKLFSTVNPYKWICKKRKITSIMQRHTPWANLNSIITCPQKCGQSFNSCVGFWKILAQNNTTVNIFNKLT